ncbi:MAG: alpha/beta hydrolase, partial [Promethearchaeota archaeon]
MIHNEDYFNGKNGLKLYYQVWRPDENPKAIVQIVHGLIEHSGRYLNVVNKLVPKGYIIYGSDHRGHGKSEGIKAFVKNFDYFVDDQKTFFELIKEKESDLPIFLLGHSMGALVSIFFASKYQDQLKGLILSGAGTRAGG